MTLSGCAAGADHAAGPATAPPTSPPAVPVAVATVRVTRLDTLVVGEAPSVQATPLDSAGAPIGVPVTWSSSDPAVVALTGTGATVGLRATGPGSATVSATAGGQQGVLTITVVAEQLARFTLAGPATVLIGKTVALGLEAVGRRGTAIRPAGLAFTSSDTTVLGVTADGQVVGRAAGTAVLTARALGATASTSIRVMPVQVVFEVVIDSGISANAAAGLRAAALRWGEVFSAAWPAATH